MPLNIDLDPSKSPYRLRRKEREDSFQKLLLQYPSMAEDAGTLNQLQRAYMETGELPEKTSTPGAREQVGEQTESPLPGGGSFVQFPETEVTPPSTKAVKLVPRSFEVPAGLDAKGGFVEYGPAGNYAKFGSPSNSGSAASYTAEQKRIALEGTPEEESATFPDGMPVGLMRWAFQQQKEKGVQGRADKRLNQVETEKAAKEQQKSVKAVAVVEEGEKFLDILFTEHAKAVDAGLFGDPLRAGVTRGVAWASGGGAGTASARAFTDAKKGFIARLKRITGDNGILTEVDANRLEGLMPGENEGKESAAKKREIISAILAMVKRGENRALSTYLSAVGVKTQPAPVDEPDYDQKTYETEVRSVGDEVVEFLKEEYPNE